MKIPEEHDLNRWDYESGVTHEWKTGIFAIVKDDGDSCVVTLPEGWTVYEPTLKGRTPSGNDPGLVTEEAGIRFVGNWKRVELADGCNHKPKEYIGFTERYMYCEKCGDKL